MFKYITFSLLLIVCKSQDLGRPDDDIRGFQFGQDITWKFTNRLRYNRKYDHPTHTILCPRTVRPSSIYRCDKIDISIRYGVAIVKNLLSQCPCLFYSLKLVVVY